MSNENEQSGSASELNEMLDVDAISYIKGLGLEHLQWKPVDADTFDSTDLVLLVTKWNGEQFGLNVGKCAGDSFMTADDSSWRGPERYVVAWAEINI